MAKAKQVKSSSRSSSTNTSTSSKPAGKNFRPHPALAVPSDLKPEEVDKVAKCVNPIIADAFALYTKTKNFHWHLSSSHFRDYHLMFDEQAEAIFDTIDVLAERVRRIGGTTIRSITHVSQLQTIKDNNEEYVSPADMIAELLADNLHIAKVMREAIDITEKARDTPTSNLLQEFLDGTERRIWFLFEVSQDGEHEN